jgi:hypothetical protein
LVELRYKFQDLILDTSQSTALYPTVNLEIK